MKGKHTEREATSSTLLKAGLDAANDKKLKMVCEVKVKFFLFRSET